MAGALTDGYRQDGAVAGYLPQVRMGVMQAGMGLKARNYLFLLLHFRRQASHYGADLGCILGACLERGG